MFKLKVMAWVTAILLLITGLYIDFNYFTKSPQSYILLIDGTVQLIMIATVAIALTLLVSIIPYRDLRFSSKFKFVLPFNFVILAALKISMLIKYIA
ncbi:hypothetical protein [Pontibacter sp. H249]|uniref:hypothetical protein n=1 Tax=Pontibacter sp. H249 TaxID=3133420 RepID=UPI0030BFAF44